MKTSCGRSRGVPGTSMPAWSRSSRQTKSRRLRLHQVVLATLCLGGPKSIPAVAAAMTAPSPQAVTAGQAVSKLGCAAPRHGRAGAARPRRIQRQRRAPIAATADRAVDIPRGATPRTPISVSARDERTPMPRSSTRRPSPSCGTWPCMSYRCAQAGVGDEHGRAQGVLREAGRRGRTRRFAAAAISCRRSGAASPYARSRRIPVDEMLFAGGSAGARSRLALRQLQPDVRQGTGLGA